MIGQLRSANRSATLLVIMTSNRVHVPDLRLRLLGTPLVDLDGTPVQFDTRKAVALLAVLALGAGPQSRDQVQTLLWPELDDVHAGSALRRTLSVTRAGLGGAWPAASGRLLAVDGLGVHVDVREVDRLLDQVARHADPGPPCPSCRRRLERAAALHRGPLLAGFGLRDSPEFDDWLASVAETRQATLAQLLDRLSRPDPSARDGGTVLLEHARRWVALDPLHEPAHRRLMELHTLRGERSEAMRQYRSCVRVLADELGVEPLPETTQLYERIAAGDRQSMPIPTGATVPIAAPPADRLPLVERGAALRLAVDACRTASTAGRLVVIEGPAGIGRTRFAAELGAALTASGLTFRALRAHPGERTLPFALVAELLSASRPEAAGTAPVDAADRAAERLLPGGTAAAIGTDEAGSVQFIAGLAKAVERAVGAGGGVLVDDAQWVDDASLAVLAYVVRRLPDRCLAIVLLARSDDPGARRLAPLRRAAARVESLVELRLAPLSADGVRRLVAAGPLGDDGGDLATQLMARSGGNPAIVASYLGRIRHGDLAGGGALLEGVPGDLADLVRARIEEASPPARQVLDAAAIIGQPFEPDLVRAVSGRSSEEVATALDELVARGLLRASASDASYDVDHETTRDVVVAAIGPGRGRLLHRRVAEALAGVVRRRGARSMAGVVATHFREAGDDERAVDQLLVAAAEAERLFANVEALEHYEAALALEPGDPRRIRERIGELQTRLGRYAAAVATYEAASARAAGRDLARLERRLGDVHLRRGAWLVADAHLGAALASLEMGDHAERGSILADRALIGLRRGDAGVARALAAAAAQAATEAGATDVLAQAHNVLAMAERAAGNLDAARDHLRVALDVAPPSGPARIAALNNLALVEREAGSVGPAIELTAAALRLCAARGDLHREAALRNNLADLLRAAGRDAEAMEELRRAVTLFAEIGEPSTMQPEIWKLVEW